MKRLIKDTVKEWNLVNRPIRVKSGCGMSQYHGFNCGHFRKICHQISRLYRYLSSSFSSCQVDTYFSHSICRWHECEESGVTCFSAWVWRRAFTAQEPRILTSHSAFSLGFWFIKGWKSETSCFFVCFFFFFSKMDTGCCKKRRRSGGMCSLQRRWAAWADVLSLWVHIPARQV